MDVINELYFLETSPVLKYLLITEKVEKQWWVNKIFEEREIYGEFHTLFSQQYKIIQTLNKQIDKYLGIKKLFKNLELLVKKN